MNIVVLYLKFAQFLLRNDLYRSSTWIITRVFVYRSLSYENYDNQEKLRKVRYEKEVKFLVRLSSFFMFLEWIQLIGFGKFFRFRDQGEFWEPITEMIEIWEYGIKVSNNAT